MSEVRRGKLKHLKDNFFQWIEAQPAAYINAFSGIFISLFLALALLFPAWLLAIVLLGGGIVLICYWSLLWRLPLSLPARSIMAISLILVLLSGIWGKLDFLAICAGLALSLAFIATLFSKVSGSRRLQQLFGSYLGVLVVIAGSFWLFLPTQKGGIKLSFVLLVIAAVIAALQAFPTRSLPVLSLVNGFLLGLAGAFLLSFSLIAGVCGGIATALLFGVTRHALENYAHREQIPNKQLRFSISAVIPLALLGAIAFPLTAILY